jgi:RNA polymerase sigma-70 factor (ECF subfamily)
MDDERSAQASADDARLVAALRAGDEKSFLALVKSLNAPMLRVASVYVSSRAVAEEVVQEAWLGVLKGLAAFQGRSSLRRWIFGIVTNCARSRGVRESRTTPFSAMGPADDDEPAVDPGRFLPPDHPRWPGHWSEPPTAWAEDQVLNKESLAVVEAAIARLPVNQREVITLRDVLGWSSEEVCESLAISEGNQRVLLHRARSKVRAALEKHFAAGERR